MNAMTTATKTVTVTGLDRQPSLRARVLRQVRSALEPLTVAPAPATIRFMDENGPKGGPAIRCALTVALPYRPAVRVEHLATTPRLAFDGAYEVLLRKLERYRERQRESKRRPKKYFAAKRLLA